MKPPGPRGARSPRRLRGLHPRLVIAFTALALVTAAATTVASYREARTMLLQEVQDAAASRVHDTLRKLAPGLDQPLDEVSVMKIIETLDMPSGDDMVVVLHGERSYGTDPRAVVPPELRETVRAGDRMVYQRFERGGVPYFAVGTTIGVDRPVGDPDPPEVYVMADLTRQQQGLSTMAVNSALIVVAALLLAVAVAVLSARRVLRPVRELGVVARRMAEGDLTARLRPVGQDELADLAATFNRTAAALDSTLQELRDRESAARRFAADVSHELRTPVAAMMAVADVLDEEAGHLDGDLPEAARTVGDEARNLAGLVEDLMEISRFDSGVAALTLNSVDLAPAIRACLRTRGWHDTVAADLPEGPEGPEGIVADIDPRRFDVILANLVGNALRHGAPPVEVRLRAEDGDVVVEVADRGPGLPSGPRERIFERFVKGDAARTRDAARARDAAAGSGGSGLGLAIAWENARLHGGSLEAASRPGGGALFTLRLPRGGERS
ncbi:two-component system, OmpR family, sensor histidine kinase MtrB [Sinosporangium album]|uniref:histidine kinase n=1 Tax=Sinosporangium album TaxID=504805 RepID=A0A1G8HXV4_9ACTN|nr:HAMP domain-containing sensor histidine kinase [Sinosporangium album]SDI11545.1 two-component system, OmpR family, sensor histidine kinase MtrB [Sinosporangium album]